MFPHSNDGLVPLVSRVDEDGNDVDHDDDIDDDDPPTSYYTLSTMYLWGKFLPPWADVTVFRGLLTALVFTKYTPLANVAFGFLLFLHVNMLLVHTVVASYHLLNGH